MKNMVYALRGNGQIDLLTVIPLAVHTAAIYFKTLTDTKVRGSNSLVSRPPGGSTETNTIQLKVQSDALGATSISIYRASGPLECLEPGHPKLSFMDLNLRASSTRSLLGLKLARNLILYVTAENLASLI